MASIEEVTGISPKVFLIIAVVSIVLGVFVIMWFLGLK